MPLDLEAVARAVDDRAHRSGSSFIFRCPVHEDSRASASMALSPEGRLLVRCHAGCDGSAVFAAVRERAGHLLNGDSAGSRAPRTGLERARTRSDSPQEGGGGVGMAEMPPAGAAGPDFARMGRSVGRFIRAWRYALTDGRLVGWVARYEDDAGKTIRPICWRGGRWAFGAFAEPRPLWNLAALADRAGAVLVVEGEKAAEAAGRLLPRAVVTWPGGAAAVTRADWRPLAGRPAVVWPDADAPGFTAARQVAAELRALGCAVMFVLPDAGVFDGWDVADMIEGGATSEQVMEFINSHIVSELPDRYAPPSEVEVVPHEVEVVPHEVTEVIADELEEHMPPIQAAGALPVSFNSTGTFVEKTESNVDLILRLFVSSGAVTMWTNVMNGAQMIRMGNEADRFVRWEDDPVRLALMVQRLDQRFRKLDSFIVERVMRSMFRLDARDPVLTWLDALPEWDGCERFEALVTDALGVTGDVSYAISALRNHFLAACVRQYVPGAKYDHVVILEGAQGIGKSTMVKAMSPAGYFREISHAQFGSRDFYDLLHGTVFVEIAELTAIQRSQLNAVKADIAKDEDVYRSAWGRSVVTRRRRCVFWATTNEHEYLHDTSGGRRYWPVRCGHVDLDWIRENRDQLWAEVKQLRASGAAYWMMDSGVTRTEQEDRRVRHPWEAELRRLTHYTRGAGNEWVERPNPVQRLTITTALDLLGVPIERRTRAEEMAVSTALTSIGWLKRRRADVRYYIAPGFVEQD